MDDVNTRTESCKHSTSVGVECCSQPALLPFPTRYKLVQVPRAVLTALSANICLTDGLRRELLTAVYNDVTQYTL